MPNRLILMAILLGNIVIILYTGLKLTEPPGCINKTLPIMGGCNATFKIADPTITPKTTCLKLVSTNCMNPEITVLNYCNQAAFYGTTTIEPRSVHCGNKLSYHYIYKDGKGNINISERETKYNKEDTYDLEITVGEEKILGTIETKNGVVFRSTIPYTKINDCLLIRDASGTLKVTSNCEENIEINGKVINSAEKNCMEKPGELKLDVFEEAPAKNTKYHHNIEQNGIMYSIDFTVTQNYCSISDKKGDKETKDGKEAKDAKEDTDGKAGPAAEVNSTL